MIELISNHIDIARSRLRQQYKRKPTLDAILSSLMEELNQLESVIYGMATNRSLYDSVGFQLDMLGSILDVLREGTSDEVYRIRLLAKIGQNVSNGTGEDVINVYKLLMRARYVHLTETYPAGISLAAVDADPIGSMDNIKEAVNATRAAGVAIDAFITVQDPPFVFSDDPDPEGEGFGDAENAATGGYLAEII